MYHIQTGPLDDWAEKVLYSLDATDWSFYGTDEIIPYELLDQE